MAERDDELQERTCRACGRTYRYPVLHSLATRFYCDDCAELNPRVRAVIERLTKRCNALATQVARLEKKLTERDSVSSS
jgi:hypothetical protein